MVRSQDGTWYGLAGDSKPTPALNAVIPGDRFVEVDTGTKYVYDPEVAAWVPYEYLTIDPAAELSYAVVDLADATPVEILGAAGFLHGIYVLTQLSNHACPVTDDDTPFLTIPALAPVGAFFQSVGGLGFAVDLELVPNASATGVVVVIYRAA